MIRVVPPRKRSVQTARRLYRPRAVAAFMLGLALASASVSAAAQDSFANALRIARNLGDSALIASLLARRALHPRATEQQIRSAVEAYEAIARPEAAVTFLEQRVERNRLDRASLLLLAELCARSGRGDEAIARYEAAREQFGLTPQETSAFVHLLAKRGKLARALEVLKEDLGRSGPPSADVLRDLGVLAWELDDLDTALDAYAQLHALGADSPYDLSRLVMLAQDAGRSADALRFARVRYERSTLLQDLLDLGELQQQYEDWAGLSSTLAHAAAIGSAVERSQAYWHLRIAAHVHDGDLAKTRDAYQGLLALDPASTFVHAGLLWNALDRGDASALARYTSALSERATQEQELWAPMAAALAYLGRPQAALRFSTLEFARHPTDDMALLTFADAVEGAGDAARAMRLRQLALERLRPRALAAINSNQPLDGRQVWLLESQARFARVTEGIDAGERWLRVLIARAPEATREFAVAWYMDDGQLDRARELLARETSSVRGAGDARAGSAEHPAGDLGELSPETTAAPVSEDMLFELIDDGREREASVLIARAQADGSEATNDAADAARGPLRELAYRHGEMASASASYARLGVLETVEAGALASHELAGIRLEYAASGRSLSSDGAEVLLPEPRLEGDFLVRARFQEPNAFTELEAALNVQEHDQAPRLRLLWEPRWVRQLTFSLMAEGNALATEETAALRVAGLRDRLRASIFGYLPASLYLSAGVEGFDDHSRNYQYAGAGLRQDLELGVRLFADRPEVSLGVAGAALERVNARSLPDDLAAVQPAIENALPRSYTEVYLVLHVGHGDWSDRNHRGYRDFPRFGCDGAFGMVVSGNTLTGLAACAVNIKVASSTFLRGEGRYAFGVAGLELANASLGLALSQAF